MLFAIFSYVIIFFVETMIYSQIFRIYRKYSILPPYQVYKTLRVFTRLKVRFIKLIFFWFWDVPWLWDCYTSVFELQEMIPVVVKSLGQFLSLFDTILFKQLGRELFAGRLPGVNGFVVRFTRHCQKESKEGCE